MGKFKEGDRVRIAHPDWYLPTKFQIGDEGVVLADLNAGKESFLLPYPIHVDIAAKGTEDFAEDELELVVEEPAKLGHAPMATVYDERVITVHVVGKSLKLSVREAEDLYAALGKVL